MLFIRIIIQLAICLILTIVIEYIPIVVFLGIPKKYFIATNVLTNVLANVVVMIFDILNSLNTLFISRTQVIVIIEALVVISEIILYNIYLKNNLLKNIVLATIANALSYFIGVEILKCLL